MKKTKLWKRIAGWLLVFLLVLQLPVNAFAGEWVDNTPYSSEENFTDEQDVSEKINGYAGRVTALVDGLFCHADDYR